MTAFYDSTDGIGALAPKLLYEDESLQHAGMYFHDLSHQYEGVHYYRDTGNALWENAHYFKGAQSNLPAANITRPVPAVTGACLMIDRALYQEIGGLRDIFVQGGYEDSDLCLRLIEAGRTNWYLPEVELYHLEDQSFPKRSRKLATGFNLWLHSHLWRERIKQVMESDEIPSDAEWATRS
jgi:GT2 family glycosyltransferase